MKGKRILWIVGIVIILILTSSGWVYNTIKSNQLKENNELIAIQNAFAQQYGNKAVIKQLISPEKVYVALWSDDTEVSHISWNIGGLWVTVWDSK